MLVFWDCQFWIAHDCLMTTFQFVIIRSGVRTFANAASHSRCIFLQKYFTFLCKHISHFYAKIVHICFKNISHFSPKVIQISFKSIFRFSPKTYIMLSPKILEKKWNIFEANVNHFFILVWKTVRHEKQWGMILPDPEGFSSKSGPGSLPED